VPFPKVVRVGQEFPRPTVGDVEGAVTEQCRRREILSRIPAGAEVAITAGSRGISDIVPVLRALVRVVREAGATPFVVPAMGSHGGATAEGQVEILRSLGVTERSVGADIRSSMDVVQLGETGRGVPVYMDRIASEAGGVIVAGRIKPHTDFHGEVESGLLKMSAIGLGKHAQALALHADGVAGIRDDMIEAGKAVMDSGKVIFGLGIVENAYEDTAMVEAIVPERVAAREAELLREAADLMPKLPLSEMDLLFVDVMGKNYSGTGMDTNVIGRYRIAGVEEPQSPRAKYLIVSRLSEASHGNAAGIGLADFTTRRLYDDIDLEVTNQNVLTSTFIERVKIPLVAPDDRSAIEAAVRCNWGVAPEDTRFVRIPNTLHLREVMVSENLLDEALAVGNVEVLEEARELGFDDGGHLLPFEHVPEDMLATRSGEGS
jgi:antitoxin (DNA-binding transcriptional repressor) of toxin-antitoxin stability system